VQAITFLGTIGDYIVSGGQDGFIRFYDPLLRIVAWFEDLVAGPITGLSFSLAMPAKVRDACCDDTGNASTCIQLTTCSSSSSRLAILFSSIYF
jgi:hypothetical protein